MPNLNHILESSENCILFIPAVRLRQHDTVRFDVAALTPRVISQAASRDFERVIDRNTQVLVCAVCLHSLREDRRPSLPLIRAGVWLVIDYDLASRNGELDSNVVWAALPVMPVRHFDSHAARNRPLIKRFEFSGLRANPFFNDFRRQDVPERYLYWKLHVRLPAR